MMVSLRLAGLETVQEQDAAIVGGGMRVLLPPLAAYEADGITFSKTPQRTPP